MIWQSLMDLLGGKKTTREWICSAVAYLGCAPVLALELRVKDISFGEIKIITRCLLTAPRSSAAVQSEFAEYAETVVGKSTAVVDQEV